ncbi:MAG: hypothetical protein P8Y85_06615 [Nitrospirota bacterium]
MKRYAHQIGAVFYMIWGVLHIRSALGVYAASTAMPPGMEDVGGWLFQGAWNMLWMAVASIVVAAVYNWKNRPVGYWVNLVLVSLASMGFIFAVLAPGYVPLEKGLIGPVVWLLAVAFSTIGYRGERV